MPKIVSGGGINSNKLVQSKQKKTEPISHKGNVAGVGQIGLQHAFKPEPMTRGKGFEPKGPTSNLGQGPGANRVIHPHGSQQRTPEPREMPEGRNTLSEFGPDRRGR